MEQRNALGTTRMECIYTPQFHRRLKVFFLVELLLLQILCESRFSERSGSSIENRVNQEKLLCFSFCPLDHFGERLHRISVESLFSKSCMAELILVLAWKVLRELYQINMPLKRELRPSCFEKTSAHSCSFHCTISWFISYEKSKLSNPQS
jgi:hypothetical protein